MGAGVSHAAAAQPTTTPYPGINGVYNINTQTYHPLQNQMAANTYSSALAAQQHQYQKNLYQQMLAAQQRPPQRWMIDGVAMDFEQFADRLYPEDCPEKTMLILRFKKED